ncbi:BamA/TamA family outer membrane protein [Maribellus mangrovi]|uniref:BamA/TamA family outer membrane protein n=1 Tax=Maribellus mangrovi TaxID=3133146 RepID=UPI0030EC2E4D
MSTRKTIIENKLDKKIQLKIRKIVVHNLRKVKVNINPFSGFVFPGKTNAFCRIHSNFRTVWRRIGTAFSAHVYVALICFFSLLIPAVSVLAQTDSMNVAVKGKKISFKDSVDGAFDVSSFLLEHRGVLPVISPITEPATGYGGAVALLYFHNRKTKYKSYVPPDVSGLIGLVTSNRTWGVGGFHSHTFGENRVRSMTVIFKPDLRIDYYGNNNEILENNPVTVNLDAWVFYQKLQLRIAESQFYVGASYTHFNSTVTLDTIEGNRLLNEIIKRLNVNSQIVTIKPQIVYDSRDNVFTPTKGINSELSINHSAKWLGSDDNYSILKTNFYGYLPIGPKLFSGWRFNGSFMLGDGPFYAYPFVSLRGIPAMRYQSDNVLVAETEWRYNFYRRWSVVGFTGVGKAFKDASTFNDIDFTYTVGSGFRYKLARMMGIHTGLDFAMGNGKDFAFYVVFGSSWQ